MKKSLSSVAVIAGIGIMVTCSLGTKANEPEKMSEVPITVQAETIPAKFDTVTVYQEQEHELETETYVEGLKLSTDERYLLAKIAMAEAEGESTEGKAMVIKVVINRVEEDSFPDTIEDVIYQRTSNGGWQFSPMKEGGRWYTTEPNDDCYEAVDMIAEGWDESEGALYFERTSGQSTWHSRHLQYLFEVGNHTFYK